MNQQYNYGYYPKTNPEELKKQEENTIRLVLSIVLLVLVIMSVPFISLFWGTITLAAFLSNTELVEKDLIFLIITGGFTLSGLGAFIGSIINVVKKGHFFLGFLLITILSFILGGIISGLIFTFA